MLRDMFSMELRSCFMEKFPTTANRQQQQQQQQKRVKTVQYWEENRLWRQSFAFINILFKPSWSFVGSIFPAYILIGR